MLGEMGADRLMQIGEGDELAGQKESFKDWAKNVFTVSADFPKLNLEDLAQNQTIFNQRR